MLIEEIKKEINNSLKEKKDPIYFFIKCFKKVLNPFIIQQIKENGLPKIYLNSKYFDYVPDLFFEFDTTTIIFPFFGENKIYMIFVWKDFYTYIKNMVDEKGG